jgi:protein-S-isoprenylcysteine O-methyltransferase Ste14
VRHRFVYRWRGLLVAPPILLSLACFWGEVENDRVIWPLGLLLFLSGWALRLWAQQHLGYRLRGPRALTTSGPYALVRNPIYIGNTLVVLGLVVASEVIWMAPIALLWCAGIYTVAVGYEERRLRRKYGAAYVQYMASVARWLPGVKHPVRRMSRHFSLRRAVCAELHVFLLIVPVVLKEWLIAPFIE